MKPAIEMLNEYINRTYPDDKNLYSLLSLVKKSNEEKFNLNYFQQKAITSALYTYGTDLQLTVAVEELTELIKEICKSKRGSKNRESILEEMADVHIMLKQLQLVFDLNDDVLLSEIDRKIVRLNQRLIELKSHE